MTSEPVFTAGQIWKYHNRPGEEESTLTILEVEEVAIDIIVNIRIDGINIILPDGKITNHIKHLPFSATALSGSLIRLIGHTPGLPPFLEGYTQWKKAFDEGKAGYWQITVKEAITAISGVMNKKA